MNKKRAIRTLIYITITYLLSSLLYFGNLETLVSSVSNHPVMYLLNYSALIAVTLILLAALGFKYGLMVSILNSLVLSFVSYKKYSMRTSRLIINDILQIDEALAISKNVFMSYSLSFTLGIVGLFILVYLLYRLTNNLQLTRQQRINFVGVGIVMLLITYFIPINASVESKGLWLDLLKNSTRDIYKETNEGVADESLEHVDLPEDLMKADKPNIVIVLSEGFWDLRHFEALEYNKDLYATYDKLSKEGISGTLESPEFGGGTSNVEFEILTGHSAHFFPPGYVFYNEEKNREYISALPHYLKGLGYKSTAIHSYEGWFYNRDVIYDSMGFEEFISSEDMAGAKRKGFYIADSVVSDYIIDLLDKDDEEQFIFAITMQNHGPYADERYGDTQEVKLLNEVKDKQMLETYGQGIYDADQSLKQLYDYIESSDEKTIVVFFGDHLPVLGENFKAYKDQGFVANNTTVENKLKLSSVPFLIWSNFENEKKEIEYLNASFLGPYLLEHLSMNINPYFKELNEIRKKLPVISRTYGMTDDYELIEPINAYYFKYEEMYKNLQFKILKSDSQRSIKEQADDTE